MKPLNPTERFSDRVSDYVKYRPTYPAELLNFLDTQIPLKGAVVADVGAGTGIFTKLLLDRGAQVEAVEPNQKMRDSAIADLGPRLIFHSGTAENTDIKGHSIDLITCAQAFHWFDPAKTRLEFQRILKPKGLVALIWNDVDLDSAFGQAYEKIKIDFGGENYRQVLTVESQLDAAMEVLFGGKTFASHEFSIAQNLDIEALQGRYFSSSYSPSSQSLERAPAERAIVNTFDKFQANGIVRLEYTTELFMGQLR